MGKVVLLGLDGATWTLLDPLMESGRLPHLARLAQSGVRGPLRSTVHPLTPAAWTSAVTGLNPGKHGIYDFRQRRPGAYTLDLVNARRRDGLPLWSMLSDAGKRVGVFNVPMTYPPDPVSGFMVSGMDAPSISSSFIHPPALREALLSAMPGYQIDMDETTPDPDVYLARLLALSSAHLRALEWLLETHQDLDVLMAVLVATDRLYHAFWRELDPAAPPRDSALAVRVHAVHDTILHDADTMLGRLWSWAGADGVVMIMSDHGFGPLAKDVYMNQFLSDAGFLHVRPGLEGAPFAEMVDWSRTRAYAFGFFGNINLNLRGREPQGCVEQGRDAQDTLRSITQALHELRDPDDGAPIVDAVHRSDELYSGPHVASAPDLLVVMRDYAYMTRDGYEGVPGRLVAPPMSHSGKRLVHTGNHRMDGVFMLAGPGVRAGEQVNGATLLDIAPTLLYTLGMPVPGVMDGRVLRDAFTSKALQARPPRRLIAPLAQPESAAGRQINLLAQRLASVEATVHSLQTDQAALRTYAQRLQQAVQQKDTHIAHLEAAAAERDDRLRAFERSLFYRAYQRWQRIFGRRA